MTADQLRECREDFMEWFRTTSPQTLDFTLQSTIREFAYQAWKDATIKANTRPTAVASHAEGEVVAWRWRYDVRPGLPWKTTTDAGVIEQLRAKGGYEIDPLYTHPPRSGDEACHVVVTRDSSGEIVAVTRQDDDGHILSVIAEKFTDDERRKFAAEYALTHMSVQAAMAARGGEREREGSCSGT